MRYDSNSESNDDDVLSKIEPGLDSDDNDDNSDWVPNEENNCNDKSDHDTNVNNNIIIEDVTNNNYVTSIPPFMGRRQQMGEIKCLRPSVDRPGPKVSRRCH